MTANAEASVNAPALENDEVAVPPKYAVPVLEKRVDEAFAKDCKAVQMLALPRLRAAVTAAVSLPEFAMVSPPAFASVAT